MLAANLKLETSNFKLTCMNKFFDFHCHPGLKPAFSKRGSWPSPWTNLKAILQTDIIDIELNPLFNEVLDSQSSLQQLCKGNINLIGLAISPAESNMGKSLWEKDIVRDGKVSLIDPGQVDRIRSGTNYFQMASEEIDHLLSNTSGPAALPGANLKFIKNYNEYDPDDINTIHAFVIVEGLHSFSPDENSTDDWNTLKTNFHNFISNPLYRVFAINPCHLQQNQVCNHAHGIQFFKPEFFYPSGETFCNEGKEMIREIYNNNILVDIKHMSLAARRNFYIQHHNEFPGKPILCTHAGVTGLKAHECLKFLSEKPVKVGKTWKVTHLKAAGYVPHSSFNCSSINLYDEDIVHILHSQGLIGISLDQRILGFGAAFREHELIDPTDIEHISENEGVGFFGPAGPTGVQLGSFSNDDIIDGSELNSQASTAAIGEIHMRYFFNNVIHILEVAATNGLSYKIGSESICIGSDFDGLIDAIECCKSSNKLGDFYQQLLAKAKQYFREAGFSRVPVDPETLLNNIFYENGRKFLERWFV